MFTAQAWKAFSETIPVQTSKMNAEQAVAAMVKAAEDAKARVLGAAQARSSGVTPGVQQEVDGNIGADLTTVRPDGVIVLRWNYVGEIAQDTMDALVARSPRESGDYIRGLKMFINGQEVPDARWSQPPPGTVVIEIVGTVPYARRLEIGHAHGHPPTRTFFIEQKDPFIFQETMAASKSLYGSLVKFEYGYKYLPDPYMLAPGSASIRHVRLRTVTQIGHPTITITAKIGGV